jgi:hypothetical protein
MKSSWSAETLTLAYASLSLSTWVRSTSSGITHGQSGTSGENAGVTDGGGH